MSRLFGKKKQQQPTDFDFSKTTSTLSTHESNLQEKLNKLNSQINALKAQFVKQSGFSKQQTKQRLVNLMKQRKTVEQQFNMISGQSMMIDNIALNHDMVKTTMDTMGAMKDMAGNSKR
ncbi:hypothetical protein GEMRC1_011567 [Eukaryota sp. GEM-RC1]